MKINFLFAGVPVANYDSALAWYSRFFGRAPDLILAENEATWQIANVGSIYLVGDAERAGNALLTLAVDDLEELVAHFKQQGIAARRLDSNADSPKKTVVTDLEGNQFILFENSGSD